MDTKTRTWLIPALATIVGSLVAGFPAALWGEKQGRLEMERAVEAARTAEREARALLDATQKALDREGDERKSAEDTYLRRLQVAAAEEEAKLRRGAQILLDSAGPCFGGDRETVVVNAIKEKASDYPEIRRILQQEVRRHRPSCEASEVYDASAGKCVPGELPGRDLTIDRTKTHVQVPGSDRKLPGRKVVVDEKEGQDPMFKISP